MDRDTAVPEVSTVPGDHAREWVEYHHETAAPSTYVYEFVWDLAEPAIGPFCTDVDGNVFMDFTGHVAASPLGYNNPKILEPLEEFDLIDPTKIAGQDFYAASGTVEDHDLPAAADLMARLTDVTNHYGMDTVFLSNSGAEAIENAIKICYADTQATRAITFQGAFHGRTLGALSLNRSKGVHRQDFPEIAGVHDVPFCDDRTCSRESCSCGFFPSSDGPSALAKKVDPERGHLAPDDVGYVVVEPIQGEGGYRFPSDAFMEALADVCATHDVHLIVDEIQSGIGRTGKWWASDHYPIDPDVVTAAKGLRVGATISREEIFPDRESRLSSTWGAGDVLAIAQGVLTIDAIEEHDLLDNATERGRQFHELMDDADLPGVVDVRGKGLMLAIEFDGKARRNEVMDAAMQRGLLTLGCGHQTLRLLPPLDARPREIELGVERLAEAIQASA